MDSNKTIQQLSDIWQKQISILLTDSDNRNYHGFSLYEKLAKFDYKHQYSRQNIIWQEGSTKLIKFGGFGNKSVLIIPSLINKSYIFDLQPDNSFIKFLQNSGINIYIIDWGDPALNELNFDIDDYICQRVDNIIKFICENNKCKISLLGHCLGGLIAIAAAITSKHNISSLALISTPYNFHHEKFARFKLDKDVVNQISTALEQTNLVPANLIHNLFCHLHIDSVINKLHKFNLLLQKNDSQSEIDNFLSIENWINDGIAMTANLAKTCFIDFSHLNITHNKQWKINGSIIDPSGLEVPVLLINSKKDKIVPYESNIQIAGKFDEISTNMGHVAMVAGLKAKQNTWQPYLKWLSINSVI